MSRQRKKKGRPISGWLILDKPSGVGSTECVSKIKWLYKAAKAGHAGTLDPLATGMLPIALGEATKTVPYVMDGSKTYRFAVTWGTETNTDDTEGEVTHSSDKRPERSAIETAMRRSMGTIYQVPPAFSAVKIDGERAYKRARDGEDISIEPRKITIEQFDIVEMRDENTTVFELLCSKGTYVRALARDLGRDLGCYGHVSELRRIAVEPFREEELIPLAQLTDLEGDIEALDSELLATGTALEFLPEVPVTPQQSQRLRSGNPVLLIGRDAIISADEAIATVGRELIAIGSVEKGSFLPKRVFTASAA